MHAEIAADGVVSCVRDALGLKGSRRKYQDGIIRVLIERGVLVGGDWDHVIDFWAFQPRTLRILYAPCEAGQLYCAMMAPREDAAASALPIDPALWTHCFPTLAPALEAIGSRGRYDVYETTHLGSWSVGRVAIVGDSAHAMPPTLAQGAGCAMMNALSLAEIVADGSEVEEALPRWEAQERPLTDHTQARAAELARTRALGSGMHWDDVGLRAALHVPTGTRPEEFAMISLYKKIWEIARAFAFGFPYGVLDRSALAVSPEERQRLYEEGWAVGGFHFLFDPFSDLIIDKEANDTAAEFVRAKIRATVHDADVAELLAPKDHPISTKRPPLEHGYYEAFNRDNVTLVDIRRAPIQTITEHGVRTVDREYAVDSIIFATGFDAMTGSLTRMDIRGRGGLSLKEKWADGPRTYLGVATRGFPNMFMITGPQSPSVLSNMLHEWLELLTADVRYGMPVRTSRYPKTSKAINILDDARYEEAELSKAGELAILDETIFTSALARMSPGALVAH